MGMQDDDLDGDVISVNGEETEVIDDNTPQDRGDVIAGNEEISQEALKDLVKDEPAEHKPAGIPKARFDEVNEAKKALQLQLDNALAALEASKQQPTKQEAVNFDEDAQEQAYIDAMLDGDAPLAKTIRREINANLRSQAAEEVEARMTQRNVETVMNAASTQALDDYPYLDTEDGAFALGLIIAQRDTDIRKGVQPHVALANAVKNIAPKFAPDDTPTKALPADTGKNDTRTQEALRRGANDSLKQPPSVQAGIGNRTTAGRVNVEQLDDDQFSNLSAAEKKRLRGD